MQTEVDTFGVRTLGLNLKGTQMLVAPKYLSVDDSVLRKRTQQTTDGDGACARSVWKLVGSQVIEERIGN
jgi:hypothetical protein